MFRSESLRIRRITKISNGVNKRDKKRLQTTSVSMQKEEVKKAPVVLMEDNLTMAKRALMVTKQLCPTGMNVQKLEQTAQLEDKDMSTLCKLKETLIRKSREYLTNS